MFWHARDVLGLNQRHAAIATLEEGKIRMVYDEREGYESVVVAMIGSLGRNRARGYGIVG